MGFLFEVLFFDVEETYPENLTPVEIAEYLSQQKLKPVNFSNYSENDLFISCDTIVVLDNEIMGKPTTAAEAADMLHKLPEKLIR